MIKHPDPQIQELIDMLEMQRDGVMVECSSLRIANKDLTARLAVAEKAPEPVEPISPAVT